MTGIANFSRWLVSIIALLQGVLFLLMAYWSYGFDRAFHAQWITHNLTQNITFLSIGVLSLWLGYVLFVRRVWAKYPAVLLFGGVIVWFLWDVLSEKPLELLGLVWVLPQ